MTIFLQTIQRQAWFCGECVIFLISHKWVLYFRTRWFTRIRLVFPRIILTQLFSHFMQITQPSTSHVSRPFWRCVILCVSVSYFASFLRVFCVLRIPSAFGKVFVSWYLLIFFFPVLYVSAFLSFFCSLGIYFFFTGELKSSKIECWVNVFEWRGPSTLHLNSRKTKTSCVTAYRDTIETWRSLISSFVPV